MAKSKKVRYLRDAKGRYAGSVGAGRELVQSTRKAKKIEAEKQRLLAELGVEQRNRLIGLLGKKRGKMASDTSQPPQSQPTAPTSGGGKRKLKPVLTPEEAQLASFNKKLADAQKSVNKRIKVADKDKKQLYKEASKDRKLKNAAKRLMDNKGKSGDYEMLKEAGIFNAREFLTKGLPGKKHSNAENRVPPNYDNLDFSGDKVKLWVGTEHAKAKEGFKIRKEKQDYRVKVDGEELSLNNIPQVAYYKGERIRGLPSTNQYLRQVPNEKLVAELANQMKYTENWDKKSVAAPAPYWDSNRYGKVPDKYKPDKGYGNMELHHIGQWYKHDPTKIKADLDSGKITVDEAKKLAMENLRVNEKHSKGYEIAPTPQGQREYVILAAGTHNATDGKKLYRANHPYGLHPETLELTEFGIPDKNKGSKYGEIDGRQYHDTIRNGFWSEFSRREAYVLTNELNRRIQSGEITKEVAQEYWQTLKSGGRIKAVEE